MIERDPEVEALSKDENEIILKFLDTRVNRLFEEVDKTNDTEIWDELYDEIHFLDGLAHALTGRGTRYS